MQMKPSTRKVVNVLCVIVICATLVWIVWSAKQIFDAQTYLEQLNNTGGGTPSRVSRQNNPPELKTATLGSAIDLGDRRITVFGFEPYSEPLMKQFYGAARGQAMDVLVENTGDSPFRLSPLHFTVQDSEGRAFAYYDIHPGGKRPPLESESVAPGQKIRAYITFADSKEPSVIYYKSPDGRMVRIIIKVE